MIFKYETICQLKDSFINVSPASASPEQKTTAFIYFALDSHWWMESSDLLILYMYYCFFSLDRGELSVFAYGKGGKVKSNAFTLAVSRLMV